MRKVLLIYFCVCNVLVNAQQKSNNPVARHFGDTEKYFSFNPFGLIEPQVAIGIGYGNRFTERSEYFTELSYAGNNYIYGNLLSSLHGARLIAQYRYHFLQEWKRIVNLRSRARKVRTDPFMGVEFRMKGYHFSDRNSFANLTTSDTLKNVLYSANALSIGGAILFGRTIDIGANGNWKLELTMGIGAKQKFVTLKDHPAGYEPLKNKRIDLGPPDTFEAVGMPYVPCTIRLRYVID
jgi:hypothetical protein